MFIFAIVLTPVVVQALSNKGVFKRYPWANAPIQTGLVGFILIFATPLGCAFFSQMASIKVSDLNFTEKIENCSNSVHYYTVLQFQVDDLEPDVKAIVKKQKPDLDLAWYNKGL